MDASSVVSGWALGIATVLMIFFIMFIGYDIGKNSKP